MKEFRRAGLRLVGCAFIGISCSSPPNNQSRSPSTVEIQTDPQAAFPGEVQCKGFNDKISTGQQQVINTLMAAHEHRLDHMLWHATRNSWKDLTATERKAIQTLSPLWGHNAAVCPLPAASIKAKKINPSGEEFLYMHHQMVAMLRDELIKAKEDCILGWEKLPSKEDPTWGMPAGDAKDESKSDATGTMMNAWMDKFNDDRIVDDHKKSFPPYLKGKSLSFVGYLIENSIHNHMHMRWATLPATGDDFSPLDGKNVSVDVLQKQDAHDSPVHNWLGNPYSAHVNPVFWKLHGWVDSVITKWLHANNYEVIAQDCSKSSLKCYQWKSTWVGGMAAHQTDGMPDMMGGPKELNDDDAQAALAAIQKIAGSFRELKFQRFMNQQRDSAMQNAPRVGKPKEIGAPGPFDDPLDYVNKFGPCSP